MYDSSDPTHTSYEYDKGANCYVNTFWIPWSSYFQKGENITEAYDVTNHDVCKFSILHDTLCVWCEYIDLLLHNVYSISAL